MTPTTIVIDFWNLLLGLVGVLVAFALVGWVFGALLVSQFKQHLELRFAQRDETLAHVEREVNGLKKQVERELGVVKNDVRGLQVLLPNEYVRREDWIYFGGTLDKKMDRLNEKSEGTRRVVAGIAERLKMKFGDDDGR